MLMWPPCRNQREGGLRVSGSFSVELVSVLESQSIRAERVLRGDGDEMNASQFEERETEPQTQGIDQGLISNRARTRTSTERRKVVTSLNLEYPSSESIAPWYLVVSAVWLLLLISYPYKAGYSFKVITGVPFPSRPSLLVNWKYIHCLAVVSCTHQHGF